MQRYNVKRSVMLAALVCAVCYLGAVVKVCPAPAPADGERIISVSGTGWRKNEKF
ncbi:MAG: hypothetical protein ACLUIR_02120 [Faecalibacterium prausnitzii]